MSEGNQIKANACNEKKEPQGVGYCSDCRTVLNEKCVCNGCVDNHDPCGLCGELITDVSRNTVISITENKQNKWVCSGCFTDHTADESCEFCGDTSYAGWQTIMSSLENNKEIELCGSCVSNKHCWRREWTDYSAPCGFCGEIDTSYDGWTHSLKNNVDNREVEVCDACYESKKVWRDTWTYSDDECECDSDDESHRPHMYPHLFQQDSEAKMSEPIADNQEEDSDDEEEDSDDDGYVYCEVGEHKVKAEHMWENFADCHDCASWKEYVEHRAERFNLEYCDDCQVVEGNSDWHTCPHQAKLVASPAPVDAPAPVDE